MPYDKSHRVKNASKDREEFTDPLDSCRGS
jgi:hypothetical protein